jgi:hypothetical protein
MPGSAGFFAHPTHELKQVALSGLAHGWVEAIAETYQVNNRCEGFRYRSTHQNHNDFNQFYIELRLHNSLDKECLSRLTVNVDDLGRRKTVEKGGCRSAIGANVSAVEKVVTLQIDG